VALVGTGALAYNALNAYRESRKPVNRLKRRAEHLAEDVETRWRRASDRLPLRVSVNTSHEDEPMEQRGYEPGMMKKLMWMALSAGAIALAGLLARRLSAAVWQGVMHEPPPTAKV
jgi:hypothetical protein